VEGSKMERMFANFLAAFSVAGRVRFEHPTQISKHYLRSSFSFPDRKGGGNCHLLRVKK
jgi:hypothetical protein